MTMTLTLALLFLSRGSCWVAFTLATLTIVPGVPRTFTFRVMVTLAPGRRVPSRQMVLPRWLEHRGEDDTKRTLSGELSKMSVTTTLRALAGPRLRTLIL